MRYSALAILTLSIFLFVALFGLPMLLSHSGHHEGCPLAVAETALCNSTILEHMSLWQSMFASMLLSLSLLIGALFISFRREFSLLIAEVQNRVRVKATISIRPTLFQELFRRGILNRKEYYNF